MLFDWRVGGDAHARSAWKDSKAVKWCCAGLDIRFHIPVAKIHSFIAKTVSNYRQVLAWVCGYVCMCVHVCVCVFVYLCLHVRMCVYACIYVRFRVAACKDMTPYMHK